LSRSILTLAAGTTTSTENADPDVFLAVGAVTDPDHGSLRRRIALVSHAAAHAATRQLSHGLCSPKLRVGAGILDWIRCPEFLGLPT
jgi:hypothetical protein